MRVAAGSATTQALADAFGRQVYFSWQDEDETVVVDTPEEWEDLVAELSEDFAEDNEFNGIIEVQLVEADQADKTVSGHRRLGGGEPAADGGQPVPRSVGNELENDTSAAAAAAGKSSDSEVASVQNEKDVGEGDREGGAAGHWPGGSTVEGGGAGREMEGIGVEELSLAPVRNPVEEARQRMESLSAQNAGGAES